MGCVHALLFLLFLGRNSQKVVIATADLGKPEE